jgi:hypothetical protein
MRRHLVVLVMGSMATISACGGSGVTPVSADAPATAQDSPVAGQGTAGADSDAALCDQVIAWSNGVADSAAALLSADSASRKLQFEIVGRASADALTYADSASDAQLRAALQASASGLRTVSESAGMSVSGATLAGDVLGAGRPPLARCAVLTVSSDG